MRLEKLIQLGPAYGYFAEPTKSVLVVAPQFEDVAKNCFKDLGITVSSGHRFLGGVIGTREYCRNLRLNVGRNVSPKYPRRPSGHLRQHLAL